MIQPRTMLDVADNSGAKKAQCIRVMGGGSKVGMPLIKDPRVKVISFTGSTSVGRTINEACAPEFKHVHLLCKNFV